MGRLRRPDGHLSHFGFVIAFSIALGITVSVGGPILDSMTINQKTAWMIVALLAVFAFWVVRTKPLGPNPYDTDRRNAPCSSPGGYETREWCTTHRAWWPLSASYCTGVSYILRSADDGDTER